MRLCRKFSASGGECNLCSFTSWGKILTQLMSLRAERSLSSTVGRGQSHSSSSLCSPHRSLLDERTKIGYVIVYSRSLAGLNECSEEESL
jgi:hypothetical protein